MLENMLVAIAYKITRINFFQEAISLKNLKFVVAPATDTFLKKI